MKTLSFIEMCCIYQKQFGKDFPKADPRHVLLPLTTCYQDPASQAELAQAIGVTQGTVSRLCGVIVAKKLAYWAAGPKENKRKAPKLLTLTPKGQHAVTDFESELARVSAPRRRGLQTMLPGQMRLKVPSER